jgi:hypothetical protein
MNNTEKTFSGLPTYEFPENFKHFLQKDIQGLLNILSMECPLSYVDATSVMCILKTIESSLKLKSDGIKAWREENLELLKIMRLPRVYVGICKKSSQGNSNFNKVFTECEDGLFRSVDSRIAITKDEIESDEKNGFVKRVS